jgi:hypothetical protein
MHEAEGGGTPPRVELSPAALATARELAEAVRAATADLPFEAEPAAFLAALERLAEEPHG